MAPTLISREKRIEQMRGYFDPNIAYDPFVPNLERQWPRNLLVGVFLHAAGRRSKRLYNSIFEKHILEIVKTIGVDDDEILEYGKMYEAHREKASETVDSAEAAMIGLAILPENVEAHPLENEYTEEDFIRHVDELKTKIVAMKGSRIVDVSKISKDDKDRLKDDDSAVTVFTGPSLTVAGDAAHLDRNGSKVVLSKFEVVYQARNGNRGGTFWLTTAGSDVEYKPLASGSREYALDFSQSQLFKGNTEGQVHSLEDEVLYDGKVNKSLACHLMCWEADNTSSEFNRLVKLLIVEEGKELIKAAVKAADQSAETLIALAATVTGFQNFLFALAASEKELDFIAEHTVVFTKEGLDALLTVDELALHFNVNKLFRPDKLRVTVPVAHISMYELRIRRVLGGAGSLLFTTFDGTSWSLRDLAHIDTTSPDGISVAQSPDSCTILGIGHNPDNSLFYTVLADGKWSAPKLADGHFSANLPALAAFKGRFISVYRGLKNEVWCTSADATSVAAEAQAEVEYEQKVKDMFEQAKPLTWSPAVRVGNVSFTADAPAENVICYVTGGGIHHLLTLAPRDPGPAGSGFTRAG